MPWTTPGTATAGEVLTAAFWNTQVRDNLDALDAAGANDVGLALLAAGNIASGGTNVDNIFSSSYANYRLLIDCTTASGGDVRLRYRVGGVESSATEYRAQLLNTYSTSTVEGVPTLQTGLLPIGAWGSARQSFVIDIFGPAIAATTHAITRGVINYVAGTSTTVVGMGGHRHTVSTAYDGLAIGLTTGTYSSGTYRIYGYRQ